MRSFVVTIAVSCVSLLGSCRDQKVGLPAGIQNKEKDLSDSLYRLFFGTGSYTGQMLECHDTLTAGKKEIRLLRFVGKRKEGNYKRELELKNGYYSDTVEAGMVHRYQLDKTLAWINSASQLAFVPAADTVKLNGEGYFETRRPLTVFVNDTIKIVISKNSRVNIEAYKTSLMLADITLLQGEFTVTANHIVTNKFQIGQAIIDHL
jgi:hypothetical protein